MSGVWDPVRAELDTEPPREPPLPAVSYIVCCTPRSGSGLLCRGLAATGLGGTPAEYFNAHQRLPLALRWGCGDLLTDYATALRAHRTGVSGVFATKLQWSQLQQIQGEAMRRSGVAAESASGLLARLLPGSVFVRLVRLDLDAQAVSLWTALHTGVWSQRSDAAAPPDPSVPYSYRGITRCRREIVEGEVGWNRFFAGNCITPVEVVYEQLVAAYPAVVRQTLERIMPGVPVPPVPDPDGRRQATERSAELVARFSGERRRRRQRRRSLVARPRRPAFSAIRHGMLTIRSGIAETALARRSRLRPRAGHDGSGTRTS